MAYRRRRRFRGGRRKRKRYGTYGRRRRTTRRSSTRKTSRFSKLNRRFKPTKPKKFWTRSLSTARMNSSTSLHANKSHIRTWLYYKLVDYAQWTNTIPALFQYQGVTVPVNAPADIDTVTAGGQMPTTFPTLAKLYAHYLTDITTIKARFRMSNVQPTGVVQNSHLLAMSWFDYSPSSSTILNSIAGSAPTINPINFKERARQVFTMQMREYQNNFGSMPTRIAINRKFSLRQWFGHPKVDLQSPILDPSNPLLYYQFYGTGSAAPANPNDQIYHHFAIVNMKAFIDAGSLFPANDATKSMISTDVGMYTTFYQPLNYFAPLDV